MYLYKYIYKYLHIYDATKRAPCILIINICWTQFRRIAPIQPLPNSQMSVKFSGCRKRWWKWRGFPVIFGKLLRSETSPITVGFHVFEPGRGGFFECFRISWAVILYICAHCDGKMYVMWKKHTRRQNCDKTIFKRKKRHQSKLSYGK